MPEQLVQQMHRSLISYMDNRGKDWWLGDPQPELYPVETANAWVHMVDYPDEEVKYARGPIAQVLSLMGWGSVPDDKFMDDFKIALRLVIEPAIDKPELWMGHEYLRNRTKAILDIGNRG